MLQHNIRNQITVIFVWAPSNRKLLIYTAPQYIRYILSLQQTRHGY